MLKIICYKSINHPLDDVQEWRTPVITKLSGIVVVAVIRYFTCNLVKINSLNVTRGFCIRYTVFYMPERRMEKLTIFCMLMVNLT